jgi:diaminopimelate decarboxylase
MHYDTEWARWSPAQWEALAEREDTPFFVFDAGAVKARIGRVRGAFSGRLRVYFAVKSNPNLGLLRALLGAVDGVDISSGGELRQALAAGHRAEDMSFAGPGKTDAELRGAIAAGVGCISAESLREIDACARIAAGLGRPANLLLRVNPTQVHKSFGLKMGGRAVQFGIEEAELPAAEARVREHGRWLVCRGIHAYVGSQCFNEAGAAEATQNALRIAAEFEARSGWPCTRLNLGGGFGVAQSGERRELRPEAIAERLQQPLADFLAPRPQCQAFFELGRFLGAEAGIYVVRVVDRKESRSTRFVVCDGGLNHQLAAAGTFGAALRGNFPVHNLSRPAAEPVTCHIAGPSCNPTDLLGVQASIAEPREGDLIGVAMSGSYGLTASPLLFLGHDTPAEWVLDGGELLLGRRRHDLSEFN